MFLEIKYKLGTGAVQRQILNMQLILEIKRGSDGLAVLTTITDTFNLTERYSHIVDRLGINIVELKKIRKNYEIRKNYLHLGRI